MNIMIFRILSLITILLFAAEVLTAEAIWLSGVPPEKVANTIKPAGMQKLASIEEQKGKDILILWIRSGIYPVESKYLNASDIKQPELFVFSPHEKIINSKIMQRLHGYTLTYDGTTEGFHNIYVMQRFVKNDTLYVIVAKAERLSHKCLNGHKEIRPKLPPKIYAGHIPYEIIRKRLARENFHTVLASGDEVTYQVLLNGLPVKDSTVLITTQKRWGQELKTDNKGEVTFQLIGDYFTRFQEFKKAKIHNFLLKADYIEKKEGTYNNKYYKTIHYTCTMPGDYIPSKTLYKSHVWALIVLAVAIVVISIFIYFYRVRRKKYF